MALTAGVYIVNAVFKTEKHIHAQANAWAYTRPSSIFGSKYNSLWYENGTNNNNSSEGSGIIIIISIGITIITTTIASNSSSFNGSSTITNIDKLSDLAKKYDWERIYFFPIIIHMLGSLTYSTFRVLSFSLSLFITIPFQFSHHLQLHLPHVSCPLINLIETNETR